MTWKVDSGPFTLKVAPKLTRSHIYPSGFEKMRVNLAFYIFSSTVEHAMNFHKEKIEQQYPNLEPTKVFINMMAQTIDAMTSRFPAEALRYVHQLGSFSCEDVNTFHVSDVAALKKLHLTTCWNFSTSGRPMQEGSAS